MVDGGDMDELCVQCLSSYGKGFKICVDIMAY